MNLRLLEARTLPTKLLVGFAVLIGLALILGLSGLQTQHALVAQMQQLYEKDLLGVSGAKDAQISYAVMGRELRQALITEDTEERNTAMRAVTTMDERLHETLRDLRPRVFRPDNIQRLRRFEEAYAGYKGNVDRALSMLVRGELAQARGFVASNEFQTTGNAVRERMDELVKAKERAVHEAQTAALKAAEDTRVRTLMLLVGGLLLGALSSWLVARSIRGPVLRVRDAVEQLAHGQLKTVVPHQDYPNELGEMARSVQVLQQVAQQMEGQNWQKGHLAQMSHALQSAATPPALAQIFFGQLVAVAGVGRGALYGLEEQTQTLRLLGAYAPTGRAAQTSIALGQGLAGQCAADRAAIVLKDPPADYLPIQSALGESAPRAIALYPLLRGERLLGVLELALFAPFAEREQALLDSLLPVLSMNLEILERAQASAKLLEETQRQAGVLEHQAEELEAQKNAIEQRMDELEKFNRLTIDREHKMIALKSEINALLQAQGQPAKYRIVE